MQFVYFPDGITQRAPSVVSSLYVAPNAVPATIIDVANAIQRGEVVNVRPASASELKRGEAAVALFEIGMLLGEKVSDLLDQETPEVVTGQLTALRDAMESSGGPYALLDRESNPDGGDK